MQYLLIVSIIWGFSFGLIKHQLAGLDSSYVAFIRLLIATAAFAPFFRLKQLDFKRSLELMAIGAFQFGLMYLCYIESFRYLAAYEVALYTIFTPIYVVLFYDFFKKRIHLLYLMSALLAVLAGVVINYRIFTLPESYFGFLLVQFSNLAFAFGQVRYKLLDLEGIKQHQIFVLPYLGGVLVALVPVLLKGVVVPLNGEQLSALLYLGVVSSALCFFLWNYGSKKTNAGNLSVFNNLKIPVAVLISVVVFGETVNLNILFAASMIFVLALILNDLPLIKRIISKRLVGGEE